MILLFEIILLLVGSKLPNQVINENGSHSTRIVSNTILSNQEEMSNNQLHIFDSSPKDVMSPPCCCNSLECIIEDEPESDKNHVVDLSSSELVCTTQKLNITNDIVTSSNVRGVIQVNNDDNITCDPIINK